MLGLQSYGVYFFELSSRYLITGREWGHGLGRDRGFVARGANTADYPLLVERFDDRYWGRKRTVRFGGSNADSCRSAVDPIAVDEGFDAPCRKQTRRCRGPTSMGFSGDTYRSLVKTYLVFVPNDGILSPRNRIAAAPLLCKP